MAQAGSLLWLVAGASLLGVVARVTIPPATWLAFIFLVHACRSMPGVAACAYLWCALYIALACGNRGIVPVAGPSYFAIVVFLATAAALPFAIDRLSDLLRRGFPGVHPPGRQGFRGSAIVPANEWKTIKRIHFEMAAFRAIENGVPLVRPASSGISSAVDAWGRLLGMADDFAAGSRTMIAQVPIGHIRTLYATTGDLFAWLCVAGVAAALGTAVVSAGPISSRAITRTDASHVRHVRLSR
jgi:hypothetical protein